MLEQAKHRLKSERGATLSMALLLTLVCVIVSSTVIAAATVSAGRVAEFGKSDQRYYSVTSAVRLFDASLRDGDLTYVLTQMRDSSGKVEVGFEEPEASGGYDFLSAITRYALFGSDEFDEAKAETWLSTLGSGEWIEPFEFDGRELALDGNAEDPCLPVEYTVAMDDGMADDPSDPNLTVEVEGRLHAKNWTLELAFHNKSESESGKGHDVFNVYMLLQADVQTTDSEKLEVSPQEWKHTTTLKWQRVSIEQGRGLPSNETTPTP